MIWSSSGDTWKRSFSTSIPRMRTTASSTRKNWRRRATHPATAPAGQFVDHDFEVGAARPDRLEGPVFRRVKVLDDLQTLEYALPAQPVLDGEENRLADHEVTKGGGGSRLPLLELGLR